MDKLSYTKLACLPSTAPSAKHHGFTLIELLMVIVLIGVLSVGAQSLFNSKDAYVDYIAKERLIALGLLGQQMALAVSADSVPPSGADAAVLSVLRAGDQVSFRLQKEGVLISQYTVDSPTPAFTIDAAVLGAGSSVSFSWDRKADMKDGNNHQVTIQGSQTFKVCLSASGYVYEC